MNNVMDKLKNTKLLGIIGNALVLVGTFLPMYTISLFGISKSVSFIQGEGVFVTILTVISLLIIFADKLSDKVPFFEKLTNQKLTLVTSAISAIVLIITVSRVSGTGYGSLFSFGFGFYLLIIGLIAAVAYPLLYKGENK